MVVGRDESAGQLASPFGEEEEMFGEPVVGADKDIAILVV